MDIDNYKPIIDLSLLNDDEIELWYNSKVIVDLIKTIGDCEIGIIDGSNTVDYYRDKDDILFSYQIITKTIHLFINGEDCRKYKNIKDVFKSLFSYQIDHVCLHFELG